jgi:hypothetical protein
MINYIIILKKITGFVIYYEHDRLAGFVMVTSIMWVIEV